MRALVISMVVAFAAVPAAAPQSRERSSDVAALQVALRAAGAYGGTVDGVSGPLTERALIAFQKRSGLVPDGIAGPMTRRALGSLGLPELGRRSLTRGERGWDVAELQFLLAWHGFPSGPFDGIYGGHVEAAVRRFQRFVGLPSIGVAGPRTIRAALHRPLPRCPLRLAWPLQAPLGDAFGPRGNAFHAGIDILAGAGEPVASAGAGRVTWAAPRGSYGNAVVLAHGSGVRTLYAHLSRIDVSVGERVAQGQLIGLVGSTGRSTGPHLHFEVYVRGAAVDPLSAMG
jgi:peptidoglycan hydrolase-like protein with peptidoglycan-binding domain